MNLYAAQAARRLGELSEDARGRCRPMIGCAPCGSKRPCVSLRG
jgi:hypothetical protein